VSWQRGWSGAGYEAERAALCIGWPAQQRGAVQATPTTWRMLLRFGWAGSKQLKALCGGEAMPIELKEDLLPKVNALWCAAPPRWRQFAS
jgi:hypothetical protein